jgi:hypothetical protein
MEIADNKLVSVNGIVCDSISEAAKLLTKISGQKIYGSALNQALDEGNGVLHGILIARVLERKRSLAKRVYREWLENQTRRARTEQNSGKRPLLRFPH